MQLLILKLSNKLYQQTQTTNLHGKHCQGTSPISHADWQDEGEKKENGTMKKKCNLEILLLYKKTKTKMEKRENL